MQSNDPRFWNIRFDTTKVACAPCAFKRLPVDIKKLYGQLHRQFEEYAVGEDWAGEGKTAARDVLYEMGLSILSGHGEKRIRVRLAELQAKLDGLKVQYGL